MKKRNLVLITLLVAGLIVGAGSLSSCYKWDDEPDNTIEPDESTTYEVIYIESENYSILFASNTNEYAEGEIVEFTVEASTGYTITSVAYNETTLTATSENTYSFTMPAEDVTLTINTSQNTYTVSYQTSSAYTVNFTSGSNEFNYEDTVEFTAEASTGYSITSVAYNGNTINATSGNTYSFSMPAEDVTLTINTTQNTYRVSYQESSAYTVNFTSGSNEYNYNDTVEFTVEATTGYSITSVAYNGTTLTATSGNTYSFTMPAEDVTLTINTTENVYTVSYQTSLEYTVNFTSGSNEYNYNDTVEFTVEASTGYSISSVAYNGNTINATSGNTYSFTMPAEDVTLTISTSENIYYVTYQESSAYTVNFTSGSNEFNYEDTVEFTVEASTGYTITSVAYNGTILTATSGNTYSFTMPAEDVTLTINTTQNTYTVSYQTSSAYTVNFTSGSNEFNYEDTVEFTVEASTGYTITSVAYNGTILTATSGNTYSFTMPAEDVTLTINTTQNTYTVSYQTSSAYTVNFTSGSNEFNYEDTVEFTVEASTGYSITSVAYNGTILTASSGNTYSFTMPAEDVTLTINTSQNIYTVSFDITSGCTVSFVSGSNEFAYGDLVEVIISCNSEINPYLNMTIPYEFSLIDSDDSTSNYLLSFTMPASNLTIDVYILLTV